MQKIWTLSIFSIISLVAHAQKKPLNHTVYDAWERVADRVISNDGRWVAYVVEPQEGDNQLFIRGTDGRYTRQIARGAAVVLTEDSRFAVFSIKAPFADIRKARIQKKKPDEMPADSLGILDLQTDSLVKIARVKSFRVPTKSSGWIAYRLEKKAEGRSKSGSGVESPKVDSLLRVIDSLKNQKSAGRKKKSDEDELDAPGDEVSKLLSDAASDLVIYKLGKGVDHVFPLALDYQLSPKGHKLAFVEAKKAKDTLSDARLLQYDVNLGLIDTVMCGMNDVRQLTYSEDGARLAFVAERDAKPKDLLKFYDLWLYTEGGDSAVSIVDKACTGMKLGMTVSEFGRLSFNKAGNRLFFGVSPLPIAKDTSLVEIDMVQVDVWHYNDDYLQTVQLSRLPRDREESFLAIYDLDKKQMEQLGSREVPVIYPAGDDEAEYFVGVSDWGKRLEGQWTGSTKKDLYAIRLTDGTKKLVKENLVGVTTPLYVSPSGKYILWYDSKLRHYFAWDGDSTRNITRRIKQPLYNELHDAPSDPSPHGVMRWIEKDEAVLIYDRYDVWKVDPRGVTAPVLLTKGRDKKVQYRYIPVDMEERFLKNSQSLLFKTFNQSSRQEGIWETHLGELNDWKMLSGDSALATGMVRKAKDSSVYIFTKETYWRSPDVYVAGPGTRAVKLSAINPQQKDYNWGTAELYKWTTFAGKAGEGILYKPENFDPAKKYPVIFYFYEKLSDDVYKYIPPTPTASRLNISFFVSRGYVVFAPDISYTIGHPAKSAYDYVVSAAKDLAKKPWIDGKNMGLQGQSWGGIQVVQLIHMTDMFKAAWAGAPVGNMTSAYGGIRWESGSVRQFQYERGQSRIGATLWEKPELYMENSPIFHVQKMKTPLVIMSNDADGAVPWYQGIELFTAMRRFGKKVWLLNYNGEAHNLIQRKNRKDIQIREQQYFDWLLKGENPPRWLSDGVPAIKKGRDWGLDVSSEQP